MITRETPPLRWVLVYFELLPPAMEYLLLVLPARENPPLRWVLVYFGLLPPAMEYLLLVPPAGAGLLWPAAASHGVLIASAGVLIASAASHEVLITSVVVACCRRPWSTYC